MSWSKATHRGDCSIYMFECDVCDCGYFREAVSASGPKSDEMWEAWAKHTAQLGETSMDREVHSIKSKRIADCEAVRKKISDLKKDLHGQTD